MEEAVRHIQNEYIRAIEKAKPGISKYLEIMRLFPICNVSLDKEFQKKYNHFYRVRQRNQEFYSVYFSYMEAQKGKKTTFEDAFNYLYSKLGRYEASFSSKLVATLNPSLPVWDAHVLKNICLKAPTYATKNRKEKIIYTYDKIINWYCNFLVSDEGKLIVNTFDQIIHEPEISDIKKVDFVLWQSRNNS